jgi:F1F0 ATPase subunit 2
VIELASGVAAAAGGASIALAYFTGLWWTVGRLAASRYPGRLAAGSFLVRAGGASAAFVALAGADALRLLIAITAFLAVRHGIVSVARTGLRASRAVKG